MVLDGHRLLLEIAWLAFLTAAVGARPERVNEPGRVGRRQVLGD
jgi:hypothetical protein